MGPRRPQIFRISGDRETATWNSYLQNISQAPRMMWEGQRQRYGTAAQIRHSTEALKLACRKKDRKVTPTRATVYEQ